MSPSSGSSSAQAGPLPTGLAALKQGRYTEAIDALEMFCQLCHTPQSQDYLHAQMGLAEAYYRIGQSERSIALCRKLMVNPDAQVQAWARKVLTSLAPDQVDSTQAETTVAQSSRQQTMQSATPTVTGTLPQSTPLPGVTTEAVPLPAATVSSKGSSRGTDAVAANVKLRSLEQLKIFYKTKLIGDLTDIEKLRQRVLIKVAIATLIFLILEGLAILFFPTVLDWFSEAQLVSLGTGQRRSTGLPALAFFAYLGLMVIGFFAWVFFWVFTAENYRETCEINITGKIVDFIDEHGNLSYFHNPGDWEQMRFAISDFRNSTIFNHLPAPNQIVQGNGVVGQLGDTHLLWSEILATDDGTINSPSGGTVLTGVRSGRRAGAYMLVFGCFSKLIAGALYILTHLLGGKRIYISHFHQQMTTGNPAPKVVFKGIFLSVALDQTLTGRTVLYPSDEKRWIQLGNNINWLNRGSGQLIHLNVPKFEQFFCVYGNNPTEARAIFSPNLMKKLFAFRKKTGQKIYLSCLENRLYVAMPLKWFLFEQKLLKNPLHFRFIQRYFEYLKFMLDIVKLFKQNPKL